jgi:hypothetical protein
MGQWGLGHALDHHGSNLMSVCTARLTDPRGDCRPDHVSLTRVGTSPSIKQMMSTIGASTPPTSIISRPNTSVGLPSVKSLKSSVSTMLHVTGCSSAGWLRSVTTIVKMLRGGGKRRDSVRRA